VLTLVDVNLTGHGEIKAEAAVTRNPCLHPGDVRKLQAVGDQQKLAHLKDCVVFSKKGNRPVTDMMAGGDLDGDIFFVCWEESIVKYIKEYEPAKYAEQDFGKKEVEVPLKVDSTNSQTLTLQMINFFIDYQEKSDLGIVSTAHEIKCAASKEGACDKEAIQLALQASVSVDAAKTGQFPDKLAFQYQHLFNKRPHYMPKGTERYEHSIIGRLYGKSISNRICSVPADKCPTTVSTLYEILLKILLQYLF
jgi:RNA-dependent RNA polymerase